MCTAMQSFYHQQYYGCVNSIVASRGNDTSVIVVAAAGSHAGSFTSSDYPVVRVLGVGLGLHVFSKSSTAPQRM